MYQPLADLLRPQTLDEVYGQEHILGEGAVLRRLIESGNIPNMVFYGPSGTGKTTFGRYMAYKFDLPFCYIKFSTLVDSLICGTSKNIAKIVLPCPGT